MSSDALCYDPPEQNRHSITNLFRDVGRANFLRFLKFIVVRKTLKAGCLSQRDCPVLARMAKTSRAQMYAVRCHGGGRLVASHSPVHCRHKRLAAFCL